MTSRRATVYSALACAAITLAGCAHKHPIALRTPAPPRIVDGETGLASWYGHPYDGRAAADGEIYNMEAFTAAHRTLPFGTWVRVVNLSNSKTVDVRITDRGPFVERRIIDLSHAAAGAIGLIGPGVAPVRLDILSVPATNAAQNWYAVQAGAFLDRDRAERLRATLGQEYGSAQLVLRSGNPPMWRVLVGRAPSIDAANTIAQRIRQEQGTAFVVRLDPAVSNPPPATPAPAGISDP
ncbi:MAG TPA: septal ring lytic transglycosylase RlpA family protein [Bryobacteraceae bacterium]|nr:septal ring lytic transglycosylase RlpA family protein [Bryobacteraceae bacterium]